MMSQINKIIEIAAGEIGYLEKKSNVDLDHKTKNAGYNNYTKYWRDLSPPLQGQPWCAAFTSWCALQAEIATSIIPTMFQCLQIRNWAQQRGLFHSRATATPQRGDLVIYQDSTGHPNHIGLVVDVSVSQITTIEGNTSSGANVVNPNGGGVFKKTYQRSNTRIAGYFRPRYNAQSSTATQPNSTTQPVASNTVVNPVLRQGDHTHTESIKELQTILNRLGASPSLAVDGRHGPLTNAAVRDFQSKNRDTDGTPLAIDGVVGPKTWSALRSI
jgi:hypothetical protein